MSSKDELEEIFAQAASRAGGVDKLLSSFPGILHRKTDFYGRRGVPATSRFECCTFYS